MEKTEKIIVYRSRAQQEIDEFIWSEDGATFIVWFAVIALAVIAGAVVYTKWQDNKRFGGRDNKRFGRRW